MEPTSQESKSPVLADRRAAFLGASGRRTGDDSEPLGRSFVLAVCALVAGTIVGSLIVLWSPIAESDSIIVATGLASAAGVLALVAGTLCIARFRLNSDRVSLAAGMILFVIGLAWIIPVRVGPMLRSDWREYVTSAVVASTAVIAGLAATAVMTPTIDSSLRVRRVASWSLIAFAAIATLTFLIGAGFEGSETNGPAVAQLLTTPILGLTAVLFLIVGQRRARWMMMFLGLGILGLQGSELYAGNAETVRSPEWLAASVLVFVAMSVALKGVIVEFRVAFLDQQQQLFESWADLQISSRRAQLERAKQEEAMHDLRAGLLGVEAVAQSGQLRSAAAAGLLGTELSRLRSLTVGATGGSGPVDVSDLLAGIVELRLLKGEAVTLMAPPMWMVDVDTNQLAEVVFNLLDNAARHAPGSPVVIQVKQMLDGTEISVQDRGPGVPPELLRSLFKRGVTSHEDGSGLGLYIASTIVKSFGGTLRHESRLGGGALFTFDLPAEPARSSIPQDGDEEPQPRKRWFSWVQSFRGANDDSPSPGVVPIEARVPAPIDRQPEARVDQEEASEHDVEESLALDDVDPSAPDDHGHHDPEMGESLDTDSDDVVSSGERAQAVSLWSSNDERGGDRG